MIEQVKSLNDVAEPYAGQVVFCEEDERTYRWDPIEGWQDLTVLQMTEYEMNKQLVSQLPNLSNKDLKEKTKDITKFISETGHKYYMLLCRELNYYTLLAHDPEHAAPTDYFGDVLIECLSFWDIKAIDIKAEELSVEIWVKGSDEEVYVMYFFPYDNGVVACR